MVVRGKNIIFAPIYGFLRLKHIKMEKKLLLGDEAIALGAIHAGLSGVYAYPGTPSTEITEFIQGNAIAKERGIHSRWCTNEKTAMEAALGMEKINSVPTPTVDIQLMFSFHHR